MSKSKGTYTTKYTYNGTISKSTVNEDKIVLSPDKLPKNWKDCTINYNFNFATWKDYKFSGQIVLTNRSWKETAISNKEFSDTSGLAYQYYQIKDIYFQIQDDFRMSVSFFQYSHNAANAENVTLSIDYEFVSY